MTYILINKKRGTWLKKGFRWIPFISFNNASSTALQYTQLRRRIIVNDILGKTDGWIGR
jgi:hypothetical protein